VKKRLMVGLLAGGLMVGLIAPAALGAGATKQAGVLIPDTGDGVAAIGTAVLTRNNSGVSLKLKLTGLVRGNVYSAWWFVGANGEKPPQNAAGKIAGGPGKATFAGHLSVDGDFLVDAADDRIVIRVLNHGAKIPGSIHKQMTDTTFGGPVSDCPGQPTETLGFCGPPILQVEFAAP
jgi:hypothetical protein